MLARRCMPSLGRTGYGPLMQAMSFSAVPSSDVPPPTLLDGRELSKRMRSEIRTQVQAFQKARGYPPHLAIVTVGKRPIEEKQRRELFASGPGEASWFDKAKGAKDVGMAVTQVKLPGNASVNTVKAHLETLGRRNDVHGLMLELPLPGHLKPFRSQLWNVIRPEKDVDGMNSVNAGRLLDVASGLEDTEKGGPLFTNLPTTPLGAMEYIDQCGFDIPAGAHCVVIGRSKLVGLPIASLLMARDATVTVANSKTSPSDLKNLCRQADVVVAAVGIPRLVKADWLKPGALVINVGTTFSLKDKAMIGDMDMKGIDPSTNPVTTTPYVDPATGKVGPSGVGPTTLPLLLNSCLANAIRQAKAEDAKVEYKKVNGCMKDTPTLSDKEIESAMAGQHGLTARGWSLMTCDDTKVPILRKTWITKDFEEAVSLINDIKKIAEHRNHHPTLHLTRYRNLTVDLSSAAVFKLTKHDLDLADEIDSLPFTPQQK